MRNTFGNSLTVTLFGESHGPAVGIVIDGLEPGITVDEEKIKEHLEKRRPKGRTETPRVEEDRFSIVSGVFNNKTCGTALTIVIPNENTRSGDYDQGKARPSHADYTAHVKYRGAEDYRGGGHFSGRITAALAAAGGILIPYLEKKGIKIETIIRKCAGIEGSGALTEEMTAKIEEAAKSGDSVGGITETVITGLPAGLGEPWFDSVESALSHILFSIGGIKGVEFGAGFAIADMKGSEANDAFVTDGRGNVSTVTNNNGGINGGITNGMPVVFRCAVKPTASISRMQKSIDLLKDENIEFGIKGRHDPAIIRRVCPVIDSVTAIVICDLLASSF